MEGIANIDFVDLKYEMIRIAMTMRIFYEKKLHKKYFVV